MKVHFRPHGNPAPPRPRVQPQLHAAAAAGDSSASEMCIFCHTPHNAMNVAQTGNVPVPLWNHALSSQQLDPYTWAAPANLPIQFNNDPLIGPSSGRPPQPYGAQKAP